jgi:hypothetical protein
MAKKIAIANAPPPPQKPPSESISYDPSKLPVPVAVQLLAKVGVKSTPDDFAQHASEQLDQKVKAKAIPEALKGQKPSPQSGEQPRQLRR